MRDLFFVEGNLVDIKREVIQTARILVQGHQIYRVQTISEKASEQLPFIMPGFIDAHVHIESSMLAPSEFARLAVVHGTVATVSDPHEIAM